MTGPPGGGRASPGGAGATVELDREIRDRLRRFGATAGVWARLVTRGVGYEREPDRTLPDGCFARLFALLELLRGVDEGEVDPDARRRIRQTERRGHAPVFRHLVDEPELTMLDCARLMVLFDDAVAFEVVREALAAGARRAPDALETTVRHVGEVLQHAVAGELISPAASATVLEILRGTDSVDPSLIPASLPPGATVSRLRAESAGALADASVIFLGAETLVVSMCVLQDPAERSGRQLVGQLTGLLLEWARAVG